MLAVPFTISISCAIGSSPSKVQGGLRFNSRKIDRELHSRFRKVSTLNRTWACQPVGPVALLEQCHHLETGVIDSRVRPGWCRLRPHTLEPPRPDTPVDSHSRTPPCRL